MHVSDIKRFLRCPRLYHLSLENRLKFHLYFNISTDINVSIAKKLKIEKYYVGLPNQESSDTFLAANDYNWIFKARFSYKGLRIRVPLLYIDSDRCDVYSILFSTQALEDEGKNMAYIRQVLEGNNLKIDNYYILFLNKDYVFEDCLDDEKLWLLTDQFIRDGKECGNIKDYVENFDLDLDEILYMMDTSEIELPVRTNKCTGKNRCPFYYDCFPIEKTIADNSILTLVSSQYKYDMFEDGIKYLKDADLKKVEGNKVQMAQIQADLNGGLYVDEKALADWLSQLKLPISFIDFEWDLFPIPPYKDMKVMDVLVFQYSLHVFDGKKLSHYEFIGEGDNRKQLVLSLLENIPVEGSVVAYNATGAEKLRIKEFADYFPECSEKLLEINERLIDMAIPFTSGFVYDIKMRGSITLNSIENMIDDSCTYDDLEVSDGMQAVKMHREMSKCKNEKQKQLYKEQLLQYCGLDSYSLYKIYKWLNKVLSDYRNRQNIGGIQYESKCLF